MISEKIFSFKRASFRVKLMWKFSLFIPENGRELLNQIIINSLLL